MEGTEPTTRVGTTGKHGIQEADSRELMSSKPLHRFVKREPRCLGIVLLMFGCAEILMGFHLATEDLPNSCVIYIPFWQGALFVVCGNLSIYTEIHPSKKMVTVCLAMYVVALLGTIVSIGYRIFCFIHLAYLKSMSRYSQEKEWAVIRMQQLLGVEGLLFTSSWCVVVLLIFLSSVARFALKSTQTQVIVQCIPAPAQSATTST